MASDFEFKPREILATIQHSSAPILLVEGRDDMQVIRRLVDTVPNLSPLPCGSKKMVLQIYEECKQQGIRENACVFLVDRDLWVFDGIPTQYDNLLTTSGYSIENDALDISLDDKIFHSDDQKLILNNMKKELSRWYAFEVYQHKQSKACIMNVSIHKLLDFQKDSDCKLRIEAIRPSFVEQTPNNVQLIYNNFNSVFRGHNLFEVYFKAYRENKAYRQTPKPAFWDFILTLAAEFSPKFKHLTAQIESALNIK
jgi:hypothetical protein